MLETAQLTAIAVFILSYSLILSGKVNRTLVAVIGAVLVVATGIIPGDSVLSFINWECLGLLAGMFIIVTALKLAGFFRWFGLHMAKTVDHHPIIMFFMLPLITGLLASFLDAVTVILMMSLMTIEILDELEIDPTPFLIAELLTANIGGSATMMSDPPNVVIGTSLGYSFLDFFTNTGPISYGAMVLLLVAMRILHRSYLREGLLKHPIHKHRLIHKHKSAIPDRKLLKTSIFALFLVVALLVTQRMLNISVTVAAISSAAIVLTINLRSSVRILKRIDWSMLVFFGGLFVLVGGLKNTGVLDILAINVLHITDGNLAIAITVIFLLSAALSIFIDNVALVAAFIPIIQGLTIHGGMELAPLTWALSLGVCFGGLATPFGTATNIAGLSTCNKMNHVICWRTYFRAALPLMALAVLFANVVLVLRYAF